MEDTRTTNERFEIRVGADVVGPDEKVGTVERVVVTPGTGQITALVVRKGLLLRRDIVIPIEAVADATDDLVQVRLSADALNALPEYREEAFTSPPADWRSPGGREPEGVLFRLAGAPSGHDLRSARAGRTEPALGGRPIVAGQRVVCRDGEVGPLDLVLIDSVTHRATHLVVRRGGLLERDTIVPTEWVREVTSDRVVLDATREQLARLPEYRPDDEITADVLDVLWYRSDLQPDELAHVEIGANDGIVVLDGLTTTGRARAAIEAVVRRVPGVLGVRNRLQSFEALAEATRRWEQAGESTVE